MSPEPSTSRRLSLLRNESSISCSGGTISSSSSRKQKDRRFDRRWLRYYGHMHFYTCEILGCMAAIAALELIVKNADFDKKKNFNADAKYVLEKVGLPCYPGGGTKYLTAPCWEHPDMLMRGGKLRKSTVVLTLALLIPVPLERASLPPLPLSSPSATRRVLRQHRRRVRWTLRHSAGSPPRWSYLSHSHAYTSCHHSPRCWGGD